MFRIRQYEPEDSNIVISWLNDEKTFYLWSAGKLGDFPLTENKFDFFESMMPFVAFDESGIVGFFTLRTPSGSNGELRIGFIIVSPAVRGKGYGKTMIQLGLKYAFETYGARKVSLGVFENNISAYHCYKSVGFEDVALETPEIYFIMGEQWKCLELNIDYERYRNQKMSLKDDFLIENGVLKKYIGKEKEIVVPENVTVIGEGAFEDCKFIKSIVIPEGVKIIDEWAFCNCDKLVDISIPESVESIKDWAFSGCSSLKKVKLPEKINAISWGLFSSCSSLEAVKIPQNVKLIEGAAFNSCFSLKKMVIPETVKSIDVGAFLDCSALKQVDIPNGSTILGKDVFSGCRYVVIYTKKKSWVEIYATERCIKVKEL